MTLNGCRVVDVMLQEAPRSLNADVPAGCCVLVDADAMGSGDPTPDGRVRGLLLEATGDAAAAWGGRLLRQTAQEVVEAAEAASTGPAQRILVRGSGALAAAVRVLAAGTHTVVDDWEATPSVLVDATGSPDELAAALRELPELGVLVTTGDAPGAPLAVDPYPDLHRRALVLVGVPGLAHPRAAADGDADGASTGLTGPQRVEAGRPIAAGAQWVQIEAAAASTDPTAGTAGNG